MAPNLAVLILAAGRGTRTRLPAPKVLLPLCGRPMLAYVLETAGELGAERKVLVLHHGREEIEEELGDRLQDCLVVDQGEPLGTGHAARRALEALDAEEGGPFQGVLLVLYGDAPLISREALLGLLRVLHEEEAEASLLCCEDLDPTGLGRILRDEEGSFLGIREQKDCSPEEDHILEVHTGFCAFRAETLRGILPSLTRENRQGEFLLTDAFGILVGGGRRVEVVAASFSDEVLGINTLAQLSEARRIVQDRILLRHMENGVLLEDPGSTIIEQEVRIGEGTRILPFTVIRNGVRIGRNCEIGPFAHLRVGAELDEGAEVGNFVEMKKSRLGTKSKAKHLTYLGDTIIGSKTNIGAGTITANYDGKAKHLTRIGDHAFIGSGTIIVAPASVGDGAMTGAGALITRNTEVPEKGVYLGVPAKPYSPKGKARAPEKKGEGETEGGKE